jgi:hypothetical protein
MNKPWKIAANTLKLTDEQAATITANTVEKKGNWWTS